MEDIKTVHYVSKDPIHNLKIRVVMSRLSVQKTKSTVQGAGGAGKDKETAAQQLDAQAAAQQQQQLLMQQQQLQQGQPVPQPLPLPAGGEGGEPGAAPAAPGAPDAPGAPAADPNQAAPATLQPQPPPSGTQSPGQAVAESFDVARGMSSGGGSIRTTAYGRRQRMGRLQHQAPPLNAQDPFALMAPDYRRGRPLGEADEDDEDEDKVPRAEPSQQPAPAGDQPAAAGTAAGAAPAAGAAAPAAPVGVIPPQPIGVYVPYGQAPGPEAELAALGKLPETSPTTLPGELPEKFIMSRAFGWQEKVYSRAEVAAAQAAAESAKQQQAQAQGQAGQQQKPEAPPSKRTMALGSQMDLHTKRLDPSVQGSMLYTFVQTDEFGDADELSRTVTTSLYEEENLLVQKLLANPKNRQQVLNFRSMYIMADLAGEDEAGAVNQKVLVVVKAFPDGSFDMCPGFSKPNFKYRFEDAHGGIYEYRVENASAMDVPSLERRAVKLERAVVARAEELRRAALKLEFQPPPDEAGSVRLLLLGEILAAADYKWDRLYVEYVVRWDPEIWQLETAWPQQEPGIVQGVTHISKVVGYPADASRDQRALDVAHFAHPIELEWCSRGPPPFVGSTLPVMFFQVCSMDKLNRYTSQGYGWLQLEGKVPGCGTHYIKTWKPYGTIRDQHAEFFIGGSPELLDLAYMTTPSGFSGKILNKYGFRTESIGAIKVRINTIAQRFNPDVAARKAGLTPAKPGVGGRSPGPRNRRELSLKVVVERARQRLKEARGVDGAPGMDIAVREGLVAEAPTIVVHPADTVAAEEQTARFKVVARGLPPLKYEWYKDDRKLVMATADQPELILVQVSLENEGAYYCQVSNKDGSINSSKATLTVTRATRLHKASGDPQSARRQRTSPSAGGGRNRRSRLASGPSDGLLSPLSQASGSEAGTPRMSPTPSMNNLAGAAEQPLGLPPPAFQPPQQGQAPELPPPAFQPPAGTDAAAASTGVPANGFRKRPSRAGSVEGAARGPAGAPPPAAAATAAAAPADDDEIEELQAEPFVAVTGPPPPVAAPPAPAVAAAGDGPAAGRPPRPPAISTQQGQRQQGSGEDLEAEDID